ncbi:hypothetical protein KUTeg_022289 [Tegillarca granosa]|uniref:Uncharacterized protein n=1 Tax=Tegillarca granosa TaxID=220873 RepID=A0ABQ9E6K5_TEGGR|nr:hypothetical protein KUTeg_022289 [Tegillarca granosa]
MIFLLNFVFSTNLRRIQETNEKLTRIQPLIDHIQTTSLLYFILLKLYLWTKEWLLPNTTDTVTGYTYSFFVYLGKNVLILSINPKAIEKIVLSALRHLQLKYLSVKTTYYCSSCKVSLCYTKDRNCFQRWHLDEG